ncbi:hypothetical protein B0T14DRAFT_599302 [Immersiella caudata]|uniref:Peptidase M43 pregnancy-associated plasma-A domain-containing protein n=1 Tax=Immersiella caudata TaxID=314043 RepID=A0AA39XHS1_9PEZI|nr:hypothetical protein B0T14DRAFT_599302 [Immersiella caudata]
MSDKREDGYLSEAEVDEQVEIIKKIYKDQVGVTFNHTKAHNRWTINPAWGGSQIGESAQFFNPMKEALHIGDYRTLNVYFRHIPAYTDFGGHCTNPQSEAIKGVPIQTRTLRDGCVVSDFTLKGSTHTYMNGGLTAVHEIGHWFGLFHPFQDDQKRHNNQNPNSCLEVDPDDHVKDTPKMKWTDEMIGTCIIGSDSCPTANKTDVDPIHNYMAYSSDDCLSEFTPGQGSRIREIWANYRVNATSSTFRD